MSSPAALPSHESPLPTVPASAGYEEEEDLSAAIPRRLMRVKVLYTFDDQNKTNCLARLPDALNIPTVSIDETTQVGVIELKTCIQAIVAASPELVAKLGHDYTVYAYDFSEYETPLVGQGMLSWILASASSTPNAPALQSKTMVTGRVCKNILGLFSNGVKETLEVKLKLVPVPTCLQSEYIESMDKYRSLSQIIPENFDPSAWSEFLKANPALSALAGRNGGSNNNSMHYNGLGGVEPIHQLLTQSMVAENDRRSFHYPRDDHDFAMSVGAYSAQGSRAGSPTPSFRSCSALQQVTQDSGPRPASRASVGSEHQPHSRICRASFDAGQQPDQLEDAPPRKRARVTRANRPGKIPLGGNVDSLRVTASAAASIRVHRPVPTNPSMVRANANEPPARAPTPRPNELKLMQQRARNRPTVTSSLRHQSIGSTGRRNSGYVSPYPMSGPYSDAAVESADDEQGGSAGETPMEFPSSPPMLPQPEDSPPLSSPVLPTLPYPGDSGFVSDTVGDQEDDGDFPGENEASDLPSANPRKRRAKSQPKSQSQSQPKQTWTHVCPGPKELLPTKMILEPPKEKHHPSTKQAISVQVPPNIQPPIPAPSSSAIPPVSAHHPAQTLPQIAVPATFLPQTTASAPPNLERASTSLDLGTNSCQAAMPTPALPDLGPSQQAMHSKPVQLPRAQTWSGETHSDGAAALDGSNSFGSIPGSDVEGGNLRQPRSGSGARRSRVIQENLERSIRAGEMPPYCHNCGEIKTPTWRKAWTRLQPIAPGAAEMSTGECRIMGYDVIPMGDGEPSQFRIYKKSITEEERQTAAFEPLQLCNPCGLWFEKKGNMRPPEKWERPVNTGKRKRGRPAGKRQKDSQTDIRSDCPQEPSSTMPLPTDPITQQNDANDLPSYLPQTAVVGGEQRSTSLQPRSNSAPGANHMDDTTAVGALKRAIQSSPARFVGTQESPIDLEADLTPKPTRRLLFPSPRKEGEVKSLGELPTQTFAKPHEVIAATTLLPQLASGEDNDKENCPPPTEGHDDLAHLFEDNGKNGALTTPKSARRRENLLKTPTSRSGRSALTPRQPQSFDFLGLETPSRTGRGNHLLAPLTPFTAQLNQLLSEANSSPSRLFDFSSFPTFNTPGRGSSAMPFSDLSADDFLSTDIPMPSSPPANLFALYEDPATSTTGLWGGTSIFEGSDAAQTPMVEAEQTKQTGAGKEVVTVDFTAIIDEVVGASVKVENETSVGPADA